MGQVITTTHTFLGLSVADISPDDVVFNRWDRWHRKNNKITIEPINSLKTKGHFQKTNLITTCFEPVLNLNRTYSEPKNRPFFNLRPRPQ
jgi:hypothetical protein